MQTKLSSYGGANNDAAGTPEENIVDEENDHKQDGNK